MHQFILKKRTDTESWILSDTSISNLGKVACNNAGGYQAVRGVTSISHVDTTFCGSDLLLNCPVRPGKVTLLGAVLELFILLHFSHQMFGTCGAIQKILPVNYLRKGRPLSEPGQHVGALMLYPSYPTCTITAVRGTIHNTPNFVC